MSSSDVGLLMVGVIVLFGLVSFYLDHRKKPRDQTGKNGG